MNEVGERQARGAIDIAVRYIAPCFEQLRAAVMANELDDAMDGFLRNIQSHFNNHGEWPNGREFVKLATYAKVSGATRAKAMKQLFEEKRLVIIKTPKTRGMCYVIPEGDFAHLLDKHEKPVSHEVVYGKGLI